MGSHNYLFMFRKGWFHLFLPIRNNAFHRILQRFCFRNIVGIKVTVAQGTLAVGTNVTIVKDGVRLYDGKADAFGMVQFPLDAGTYFVLLDRGGYPRHVNLLEVNGSNNVSYTMRQLISYASVYGQVTGPTDFSNASVGAYSGGNIVKRVAANKDGYYIMSFLPDGQYDLSYTADGFIEKKLVRSLYQPDFTEVNVALSKMVAPSQQAPTVMAPGTAEKQSIIEVTVVRGGAPMAGVTLSVETPSGNIEVTTGADGIARVNAVKAGTYRFIYGNLSAVTIVPGANETPAATQNATEEPQQTAPAQQPAQAAGNGVAVGLVIAGVVGLIAAIAIILFAISKMGGKQAPKREEPDAPQEKPASAQEKPHHAHKHEHHHKK